MVLVDTSVWISHLRQRDVHLELLLNDAQVICHEWVVGELACGNLRNRREILSLLQSLPSAPVINHEELLFFIEQNSLMGSGVGIVDAHLLASAKFTEAPLWTSDTRLKRIAARLKLFYQPK